jgi:hypothetical protein
VDHRARANPDPRVARSGVNVDVVSPTRSTARRDGDPESTLRSLRAGLEDGSADTGVMKAESVEARPAFNASRSGDWANDDRETPSRCEVPTSRRKHHWHRGTGMRSKQRYRSAVCAPGRDQERQHRAAGQSGRGNTERRGGTAGALSPAGRPLLRRPWPEESMSRLHYLRVHIHARERGSPALPGR